MRRFLSTALILVLGSPALAVERNVSFGAFERVTPEAARALVETQLKAAGKLDASATGKLDGLWKQNERNLVDRVPDGFALGDAAAAKLLADAHNPATPAPIEVPEFFKDAKVPAQVRANVALAYARALANRKVYEEGLAVLKVFSPEQVVDPAAYLFARAVSEHALLQKAEATRSISRLLDEASSIAPDRYKTVATLMLLDMHTWKEKDLGSIARKMENIERRLELARGGPQTQKMQKEVVARLDEIIKKLENQSKGGGGGGGGQPNGGNCPSGGQQGQGGPKGNNPSSPATESGIANVGGSGQVEKAKLKHLVEEWGRLPPRERERSLQELTQEMSPRHREAIQNYFRNLAQVQAHKR